MLKNQMFGEMDATTFDPIEEFIGEQLRSISFVDPSGPKKDKGKKSFKWWPYQHHRSNRSLKISTYEDRLIDALDKKYKRGRQRQDKLSDLLEKGYTKKESALLLGISHDTITRDIKKIKRRLRRWDPKKLPT